MTIRAVIFDRDGVLTSFNVQAAVAFFQPLLPLSIFAIGQAWQEFGEMTGFPRNAEEEEIFFSRFWTQMAEQHRLSESKQQQLQRVDYTDFLLPFPDALTAMQTARAAGHKIGVLSNFSLATLDSSLAAVGLSDWVDVACAATVIGAAKPEPLAYQTVAERLDCAPQECLFFDDERACVEGAKGVGMDAWLVDRTRASHDMSARIACDLTIVEQLL